MSTPQRNLSSVSSKPTNAGIITDASGVRHIPESTRADGSTRRAIKIRPGYQPPEDVALYKNRTAEQFRNRLKTGVPGAEAATSAAAAASAASATTAATDAAAAAARPTRSIPGHVPGSTSASSSSAAAVSAAAASSAAAAASNKNAKRREARKKAAAASAAASKLSETPAETSKTCTDASTDKAGATATVAAAAAADAAADATADREKKARGLKKKLKQARELKSKSEGGEALLPEQIAKVIRIHELVRELAALGIDTDETGDAAAGKTT